MFSGLCSTHVYLCHCRESKITHLFRDVLHGYGHLVLSVSVSPMALDYEETHHVLRYAALAGSICLAVLPPEQDPPVQGDRWV
jgi:hypothetical protein